MPSVGTDVSLSSRTARVMMSPIDRPTKVDTVVDLTDDGPLLDPLATEERISRAFEHLLDGFCTLTAMRDTVGRIVNFRMDFSNEAAGVITGGTPQLDGGEGLVEAGALCHLDTGLTLAIHTGDGTAAMEILEVLHKGGVSPEAYVWVHSQNDKEQAGRSWAAQQGSWVELDGVGSRSIGAHVEAVLDLWRRGRLDRVLVSQDAGWYHVGEAKGGTYRAHTDLFDTFLPALRARGLGDAEIQTLLVDNPARAFAVRRRPRAPSS